MHPRIKELTEYLDVQYAALREALDSVPPERRGDAPGPDRWSPAGIIEHLAIVERSIARLIIDRVAAARASGIRDETETSSVVESFAARPLLLDRTRRITSSERSRPTQNLSADAAWVALDVAHRELRSALLAADGLALGEITHPHPVFGPLNLYHWVVFVGGHEARHAEQIREAAQVST